MIYIICFQALFDYQPSKDDEQQVIAWLTLMEKAYCHFQRYIHVDIDITIIYSFHQQHSILYIYNCTFRRCPWEILQWLLYRTRAANYRRTSDNVRPNLANVRKNQILIGHNVRPNKIYCLIKTFCFIMLKEKLLFFTKKAVRFPFVIQSTG